MGRDGERRGGYYTYCTSIAIKVTPCCTHSVYARVQLTAIISHNSLIVLPLYRKTVLAAVLFR